MAEEVVDKVAMLLEQLSSRFDLVVEVAEGFSGKLQALHEEMVSQFSEVGKQIRFLSDQIGDNRAHLTAARSDLSTEIVRLNEALGSARVQIRQDLAGFQDLRAAIQRLAEAQPAAPAQLGEQLAQRFDEAQRRLSAEMERRAQELKAEISQHLKQAAGSGAESTAIGDGLGAEIRDQLKASHKALTSLAKKFERFDDKITVQVKDHEQRLRKIERQARG